MLGSQRRTLGPAEGEAWERGTGHRRCPSNRVTGIPALLLGQQVVQQVSGAFHLPACFFLLLHTQTQVRMPVPSSSTVVRLTMIIQKGRRPISEGYEGRCVRTQASLPPGLAAAAVVSPQPVTSLSGGLPAPRDGLPGATLGAWLRV